MRRLEICERLALRPVEDGDAESIYALVDADRERLAEWMPWAAAQTLAGTREFVAASRAQAAREDGYQAAILHDDAVVGIAGFHRIDRVNLAAPIGYWISSRHEGEGLMTAAVGALVDQALGEWGLHRLTVEAAVGNRRSRAVAERLGFRLEAVLRDSQLVGGRYHDGALYALLDSEWGERGG